LQKDARNLARYREFEREFGSHGVFRTQGAVFRHYSRESEDRLLGGFDPLWRREGRVLTLNGNEADIFQVLAQKSPGARPPGRRSSPSPVQRPGSEDLVS